LGGHVGLEAVEAATRVRLRGDEARGVPAWDLLAAQLVPTLLATGHITSQLYGEFSRVTHDSDIRCAVPIMTAARGRRPTSNSRSARQTLAPISHDTGSD
jgi:hypothetical protein